MHSTYLTFGGACRERIISDTWQLLLDRRAAGTRLRLDDLERVCEQISPEWRDDPMSIAAALVARAHGLLLDTVDALPAAEREPASAVDISELLEARELRRDLERLTREAAGARRQQGLDG